jgi:hypothetical protein
MIDSCGAQIADGRQWWPLLLLLPPQKPTAVVCLLAIRVCAMEAASCIPILTPSMRFAHYVSTIFSHAATSSASLALFYTFI